MSHKFIAIFYKYIINKRRHNTRISIHDDVTQYCIAILQNNQHCNIFEKHIFSYRKMYTYVKNMYNAYKYMYVLKQNQHKITFIYFISFN